MKYCFKVSYYDTKLKKDCQRSYFKALEPNELNIKARDFLIWFRSLPGVTKAKLDVVQIVEGDTLIKGLCL